jgi:DNA-binding transcriptional regulator GbsR (MarR family)
MSEKVKKPKIKRGYFYIEEDVHLELKSYCTLTKQRYIDVVTKMVKEFLGTKDVKEFLKNHYSGNYS